MRRSNLLLKIFAGNKYSSCRDYTDYLVYNRVLSEQGWCEPASISDNSSEYVCKCRFTE